jgi:hypothetical protein
MQGGRDKDAIRENGGPGGRRTDRNVCATDGGLRCFWGALQGLKPKDGASDDVGA